MADEKKKPELISFPAGAVAVSTPRQNDEPRPKARRRRRLTASLILFVLLPWLAGAFYYATLASDRYVAGAGFAVRGVDARGGADFLGAVTGIASTGSTTSDSYILLNYLESRALVEKLEADLPLRDIYSAGGTDLLYRLDPTIEVELLVDYWAERIHTAFDANSGIITFEVEAFRANDAERIADRVLVHARELINQLSQQARRDSVAAAEAEVNRAELRLETAVEALRKFREGQSSLDPAGTARLETELVGGLERQLADLRARAEALKGSIRSDSPAIRKLNRQAEALEKQIAERRRAIGTGDGGSTVPQAALTSQLAQFETLEVERNFAQQSYLSALSSLESARLEADRQQRYLAIYAHPATPQYPPYPRRLLNIFLLLAALSIAWGIAVLMVYAVRDHVS